MPMPPPAKIAAVIPARHASTRLPGKPLLPLAGKPLLAHVWERVCKARGIAAIIIATDDIRIAEAAFDFGAEVALTSAKHRSGTDRVAEVARRLKGISHIINVQADEPFIDPALITRLAQTLAKDRTVQMITAASRFAPGEDITNPNAVKVVCDRAGDALYFSRSAIPHLRGDGAKPAWLRHHGIYGYTVRFLDQFCRWKAGPLEKAECLEQLRALENGAAIRVVLTRHAPFGVDTPEDAAAAESLLARRA
jgi:3-deoxy-manno-octulosonate cytidylyltransferase (CMP-KDO synthetase)